MSKTAALQYFGRAVPVLLRKFPKLDALRIASPIEETVSRCDNKKWSFFNMNKNPRKKYITIPTELDGQLNMIVIGFEKTNLLKHMFSWYSLGRTLHIELNKKYPLLNNTPIQCYTLFIFPRFYRCFHWWFCWRYKRLIRAYAVNKIKVQETDKMKRLAEAAGIEYKDPQSLNCYDEFCNTANMEDSEQNHFEPESEMRLTDDLSDEEFFVLLQKRQRAGAFIKYCQATKDAKDVWKYANTLIEQTFISYTNRRLFLESLQLPDYKRGYVAIINKEGKILWFEDEDCTISKANDALDRFKLEYMMIPNDCLPKWRTPQRLLYCRGPEMTSPYTNPLLNQSLNDEKKERFPRNSMSSNPVSKEITT